jgi:lambda repressor-like predicted transcriptional regulator
MTQNVGQEKRSLLALALASGTSIKDAAEEAGISRRTVERCLARPAFRRLVARLRGDLVATALGRLTDNMTRAADAVAALLDAPEPHLRLRAARALMSFGLKFRDSVDVTDRIRDLERELARRQGIEP